MIEKNIINGKWYDPNDVPGIGVGKSNKSLAATFTATLEKLRVSVEPKPQFCTLSWEACDGADRYRMDLYHIEDRGSYMNNLNYVAVQSTWTNENHIDTIHLKPMNSYHAVVFAYKGEECLGRYTAQYCVVSHSIIGDMLYDNQEEYEIVKPESLKNTEVVFSTLPAEKSVLLNDNPDRGFRTEALFIIPDKEELSLWTPKKIFEDVKDRIEKSILGEKVKVSRVYFILQKYSQTKVLPQAVLNYMDSVYDAHRKLGVKMYLCHFYMRATEEEHPSQETVLGHLQQVRLLFEKHKDVLFAANFTFLGRYGEWTCIRIPFDMQAFVNAFMDAMPKEIRLIMRQPEIKSRFINKDYWRYSRIGFADDACHGLMFKNIDLGQGTNQPGSVWWDMNVKESPYTINDTELFTTRWIRLSGSWPDGYSCMQSLSQKHTSTLSIEHGYSDIHRFGGTLGQTCLAGWKGQEVTPEILKNFGLAVSPSWFTDKDGKNIKRNVFEYMRDYLGYRFSAEKLNICVEDNEIAVALNLKNYGYAAGFNLQSKLVILNEKGNVVNEVKSGNPEEWYGTIPVPYENRELLCHTVSAKITIPEKLGTYSLALRLENSLGQTARLDNKIPYVNGNNILYSFSLGE